MAALWAGLLTGPLAWLALLETNYVLAYAACETQQKWFLHAATLAAVGLVAAAGWWAWRSGPPEDDQRHAPPVTRATSESRARWMSLAGIALSAWFILVMLAMEIPILIHHACD
jgi:uncharacterized membrane protein YebE (DUF533 family)